MNKTLRSTVCASVLVSIASPALAVPTLYPRPGNRLPEVVNPTNSAVISDSRDANQQWVLPPLTGRTKLSGVFAGANVGFCPEMSLLQSASFRLAQRIEANSLELETVYAPELESLRQQKAALALEAASFYEDAVADAIRDLEDAIDDAASRTEDLREQRDNCESDQCEDEISEEIEEIADQRRADRAELADLRREYRSTYQAHEALEEQAEALDEAMDDVEALSARKLKRIIETKTLLNEMYASYGKLEGALGNMNFQSGWQTNVQSLIAMNAGKGMTFNAINTHDARINVALVPGIGSASYLSSLPVVLDYTINGLNYNPLSPVQSLPSFPDSIGANVRLSLIGACPTLFPEEWNLERQDGVPLFGLTASYQYDSAFRTKAVATYNLHKIYEYYKKVEEDGGFFSSETKVTEWKNESGEPVVNVEVFDESGLSEAQINEIKEEVALMLLQDVLMAMGVPGPAGDNLDPMPPPAPGAVVIADGLSATCGWSIWCLGGSWLLRGLHAIFGGSTAEASFKSTYDVNASRTYDIDRVQPRPAISSYE